jgi:hypothetical protein
MIYPTPEYVYVDENGQNVEPSRFAQHVYTDNNDQSASHMVLDENTYYHSQQQTQYGPLVVEGSQPL